MFRGETESLTIGWDSGAEAEHRVLVRVQALHGAEAGAALLVAAELPGLVSAPGVEVHPLVPGGRGAQIRRHCGHGGGVVRMSTVAHLWLVNTDYTGLWLVEHYLRLRHLTRHLGGGEVRQVSEVVLGVARPRLIPQPRARDGGDPPALRRPRAPRLVTEIRRRVSWENNRAVNI